VTGAITAAMGPVLADPWRGHMGGGTWMWLWVPLTIVLLVGVVGLVGVIVARGSSTSSAPPAPERRAREILMERYARGEIDTEEFEERSARLR
jgi:putative membrane protein